MDRPIPILATIESICFDYDSFLSRVTPSSLVSSTCSIATSFNNGYKRGLALSEWFVPEIMHLLFEIFYTSLLLVTHSKTDWSSMLSVLVVHFIVAADVYTVESSAYIDSQALFQVSGRSFVKTENNHVQRRLTCGTPHWTEFTWERLPLKKTLCVLLDR